MLQFKSCPRCGGDVHVDKDWYGEYRSCLQCGWSRDISDAPLADVVASAVNRGKRMETVRRAS